MFSEWLADVLNRIKLNSYQRRFSRLKSKYFDELNSFKRVKIKAKIAALLNLVRKLGDLGKSLEGEISRFIEVKGTVRINPSRLGEMVQNRIEDRAGKVVITINPNHLRDIEVGGLRDSVKYRIQKRGGVVISSMSTLRKPHKDELPPEIKHERFKAD